jgi:hypothetical protein
MKAESFVYALKNLYKLFPESFSQSKIPQSSEKACYIEAVGDTANARMYYSYVFKFAVKAGLKMINWLSLWLNRLQWN